MAQKPLVVLKIGTNSIITKARELNMPVLEEIVRQIVALSKEHFVVLVSSGAVGAGRKFLTHYQKTIAEQKAAAAIGNPLLLRTYQELFSKYTDSPVAQALCEKQHFSDRRLFLQLWETFQSLWDAGAIPIVNENDVISDFEIRFSDNDELATMIAVNFGASKLLLGTSVAGFLQDGKLVPEIANFDDGVFAAVTSETSSYGRGGMASKLKCARMAVNMGVEVAIFDAGVPGNILAALEGKSGTQCRARTCSFRARQRWMGTSTEIAGRAFIDDGAVRALQHRKSLLMVGVMRTEGDFDKGDFLQIVSETTNRIVAVGRCSLGAEDIRRLSSKKGQELVSTDEVVLLD